MNALFSCWIGRRANRPDLLIGSTIIRRIVGRHRLSAVWINLVHAGLARYELFVVINNQADNHRLRIIRSTENWKGLHSSIEQIKHLTQIYLILKLPNNKCIVISIHPKGNGSTKRVQPARCYRLLTQPSCVWVLHFKNYTALHPPVIFFLGWKLLKMPLNSHYSKWKVTRCW